MNEFEIAVFIVNRKKGTIDNTIKHYLKLLKKAKIYSEDQMAANRFKRDHKLCKGYKQKKSLSKNSNNLKNHLMMFGIDYDLSWTLFCSRTFGSMIEVNKSNFDSFIKIYQDALMHQKDNKRRLVAEFLTNSFVESKLQCINASELGKHIDKFTFMAVCSVVGSAEFYLDKFSLILQKFDQCHINVAVRLQEILFVLLLQKNNIYEGLDSIRNPVVYKQLREKYKSTSSNLVFQLYQLETMKRNDPMFDRYINRIPIQAFKILAKHYLLLFNYFGSFEVQERLVFLAYLQALNDCDLTFIYLSISCDNSAINDLVL